MTLFEDRGATFSPCGSYRTELWRIWDPATPPAMFLMLNPSTADHTQNDPTVERCERRARMWHWGGLLVGNIFALRSTDPRALYSHPDPVGQGNDEAILRMAKRAGIVICGWGTHGALRGRGDQVLAMLNRNHVPTYALRMNSDGSPGHPLYVGYAATPIHYSLEAA